MGSLDLMLTIGVTFLWILFLGWFITEQDKVSKAIVLTVDQLNNKELSGNLGERVSKELMWKRSRNQRSKLV